MLNNKILVILIVSIIILAIFIKNKRKKVNKETYDYNWEVDGCRYSRRFDAGCDKNTGLKIRTYSGVRFPKSCVMGQPYTTKSFAQNLQNSQTEHQLRQEALCAVDCEYATDGKCITEPDGKYKFYQNFSVTAKNGGRECPPLDMSSITNTCTKATGRFVSKWGTKGSGTSEFSGKNLNCAIYHTDNIIFVSDIGNNRIQVFDINGNFLRMFGSKGKYDCQFNTPNQIAVSNIRKEIYIADSGNNRIQVFDLNGNFLRNFGSLGKGPGQMLIPTGVALTQDESQVIVIESIGCRGQVFTPDGTFIRTFGEGPGKSSKEFMIPWSVAIGRNGEIVIMDTGNNKILIFDRGYTHYGQIDLPAFPIDCQVSDWVTTGFVTNTRYPKYPNIIDPTIHTKYQKRYVKMGAVYGGRECPPLKQVVTVKDCIVENQRVCTPYVNEGARGGFISFVPTVTQIPQNGGTECPNPIPPPYPAPAQIPCPVEGKCPWGFLDQRDGTCYNSGTSYKVSIDPNNGETLSQYVMRSSQNNGPNMPFPSKYLGIYGEKNLPKRLLKLQKQNVTWQTCRDSALSANATLFSVSDNKLLDRNIVDYSADKVETNCYYNENDISYGTSTPTKINGSTGLNLFQNYTGPPINYIIQDTAGNVYPASHTYDVQAFYTL